jgi:HD-GYP domain-containing protein (c-di-GMP phosphodiesterase class II)
MPKHRTPSIIAEFHGLTIHDEHDCLESVRKKSTEIALLARGGGPEVMLQAIAPGSRITVPAEPSAEGFEFYYILSGSLEAELGGNERRTIRRGQYITVGRLQRDVLFRTDTGVTLLYVSSRPIFHELSDEIHHLLALAKSVEEKDPLQRNHCERLQRLALTVGEELHLPTAKMEALIYAAFLHDVGKADLPQEIISKTGAFTNDDWQFVREHPSAGRRRLETTYIKDAAILVEQHHERMDGRGYPQGLKGEQIRLEASIIAAVDAYDAMISDRPYRDRLTRDEAFTELRQCAGTQFDPVVVEALIKVIESGATTRGSKASEFAGALARRSEE